MASTNKQNDKHPDPFAGQYPTPPPPPESFLHMAPSSTGTPPAMNVTAAATTFYSQPVVHQPQTGYFPQEQEHPWPTSSAYSHPSLQQQQQQPLTQQEYFPPPSQYDHHRSSYDHSAAATAVATGGMAAYDPHRISYDHGEGYDPVYNQPVTTNAYQQNDPSTYYPHPNTNYYTEDLDGSTSPNTPIIPKKEQAAVNDNNNTSSSNQNEQTTLNQHKEKPKRASGGGFGWFKNKQRVESTPQQEQPILPGPRPAPEDEKPSYQRPAGKDEEDGGLRNACCCYNPALTCCSFFWMLISLAFLAGGIAMMVASKIVQDRCNNECGGSSEATLDSCSVLCSNALHQALLWAGLGILVLAAISVIWRLFTWCCAGCARRK